MEFKTHLISEVGKVIGGGTPRTSNESYYNGDIPWITPRDLSNHDRVHVSNGSRNISKEGLENSSARLLPKDSILMSSRAPIGYLAIAENELTTNQGFKSIICDQSKVNPYYLYYYLMLNMDRIKNLGTGSTFSEISGKVVKNILVTLPSLDLQNDIANILLNIDKKIETNQEVIANLEELSQTLFKRWFIDFEFPDENGNPYKASGGELLETSLGSIPLHFKVGKIEDICELKYGKALPKKKRAPGKYPVYGSGGITGTHNEFLIAGPGIIIGRKGTIGTVYKEYDDFFPIDTVFYVASELYPVDFLYQLFLSLNFKDSNSDSAVPGLNRNFVHQSQIVIPDIKITLKFNQEISLFSSMIFQKEKENKNLIKLRDILLPKLMSGELELPEALEV